MMSNLFWKCWLQENFSSLTERRNAPNLAIGDQVLVIDKNSPWGRWPLEQVMRSTDEKWDLHVAHCQAVPPRRERKDGMMSVHLPFSVDMWGGGGGECSTQESSLGAWGQAKIFSPLLG